jgi:predicted transcriptional regulator
VSDNAANVVAAVRVGGWRHLRCFAHTLNLIVQKELKEIDSTLSKIRRIVTFFKKSSHPAAKLKIMQEQMHIPVLKPK